MPPTSRAFLLGGLFAANLAGPVRAQPLFESSYRIFPTSGDVHAIAAGRLARDSAVSVVVSHPDRQTLELLAADDRGNLVSRAIFRVPNHPLGVAIADFDRDGCADVVAGGYDPNGLVLLHGRLEGGFDPPTLVAAAESVDGIAVADLDADGFADLLGWSGIGGNAFLNDRSGGFRPPVPFSGSGPAVGRLDPDPFPDLVFGAQDSVTVRYGLGDGTFGNERSFHAGCSVSSPSVLDLDGDGDLDIVAVDGCYDSSQDNMLSVLLNDGQGKFPTEARALGGYGNPAWTAIGDVDGDHHPDVIGFAWSASGGPVMNFLMRFDAGSFGNVWGTQEESSGYGIAADVNGDGADDFLQVDGSGIAVFMGSPTAQFHRFFGPDVGDEPRVMTAIPLDDGPTVDLVVPSRDAITVAYGNGDGTFRTIYGVSYFPGDVIDFTVADLNLDGHEDLAASSYGGSAVALGRGDGTFASWQQLSPMALIRTMRVDGDSYPDLLFIGGDSLRAWRNRGDATFEPWRSWAGGGNLAVVRDLDGDGRDDIVLRRGLPTDPWPRWGTMIVVRLGAASGDLGEETVYETGAVILDVQILDLDGDGHPDIAVEHNPSQPGWLRGRGNGSFEPVAPIDLPPAARLVFADFNGDGRIDAATLSGRVGVSLGAGGGSFTAPLWFGTGRSLDIAAGDFDGDGRADLAVLNQECTWDGDCGGFVDVMLNRIGAASSVSVGETPQPHAATFAVGNPSPNPFRSVMRIRVAPGAGQRVDVRILDIAGREVRALPLRRDGRDEQEIVWDARDARGARVPPGVYLLHVGTESASTTRRVVVLR